MFMFKKAKVGLTKGRDFAINLIEQRQAAKELAELTKKQPIQDSY